jgi:hypothetical protein
MRNAYCRFLSEILRFKGPTTSILHFQTQFSLSKYSNTEVFFNHRALKLGELLKNH